MNESVFRKQSFHNITSFIILIGWQNQNEGHVKNSPK